MAHEGIVSSREVASTTSSTIVDEDVTRKSSISQVVSGGTLSAFVSQFFRQANKKHWLGNALVVQRRKADARRVGNSSHNILREEKKREVLKQCIP